MRKVLISFIFTILVLSATAQDNTLSNKIIKNGKEYYLYEVQPGEGYMAIGRKFGVAYKDIVSANSDIEGLKVGQVICVPVVEGRNANENELKSDKFFYHKVDSGETVFFISRQYDVTLKDIYDNNPGSDEVLSIGQELKIPKKVKKSTENVSKSIYNMSTTDEQETPQDSFLYHTVSPEETAYRISKNYGISLATLVDANPGIDANKIPIGTKLRIPKKAEKTTTSPETMQDMRYTYHRIKQDETLPSIAEFYHIPEEVIKNSNGIEDQLPPVGYMLKIPHSYQFSTEENQDDQVIYTIKRKDDIRDIAEQYQVPIMDIMKANPDVKKWNRLKKGTDLIIPTLTVASVDSVVTQSPQDSLQNELDDFFNKKDKNIGDTINIAFIWPLYTLYNDTINNIKKVDPTTGNITYTTRSPKIISSGNFREFYLGALIALNDLKEKGVVVKVRTYDTERGYVNIHKTLQDKSLLKANIIFGPVYDDQIKVVADFCLKNHIRMIVPKNNCKYLTNNPFIYQIFPSASTEYAHSANRIARVYDDANIIMIKGKTGDQRETAYINALKAELYNPDSAFTRHISYKEINYANDNMSGLSSLLNKEKQNIIIIPAQEEQLYTTIVPVMDNYASKHKELQIKLLGFDEWQNFKGIELENIFDVGCEIQTPLYANLYEEKDNIAAFKKHYYDYFMSEPSNQYPYYGLLGYDVVSYFVKGLFAYGNHLENHLNDIPQDGLCVDFKFERVNNWGGFENKTVYSIEYTNEFEIKKVE